MWLSHTEATLHLRYHCIHSGDVGLGLSMEHDNISVLYRMDAF